MIVATLLALLPSPALAASQQATLRCGSTDLTLVSRGWASRPSPVAPNSQVMTRRVGRIRLPVALEQARTVVVDGFRVRNNYVQSWACVTSTRGVRYVYLGYACAVDRGAPHDCSGEQEWFRLLDQRGRVVDAGVPHEGAARNRLDRRLGLEKVLEAGVKMAGVIG